MSNLPDQYQTATLVNGLATCTFAPQPYPRRVTSIVIGNTTSGPVFVYRGSLTAFPISTNLLGSNNVLNGSISLPTGQQLFVQWSVAGSPVSGAFARVSFQKVESPLDETADSHAWDTEAITSFFIPTTVAATEAQLQLITGNDIPTCMQSTYAALIMERPQSPTTLGNGWKFWGVRKNPSVFVSFEEGLYYTDGTTCGFLVTKQTFSLLTGGTQLTIQNTEGLLTLVGTVPGSVSRAVTFQWNITKSQWTVTGNNATSGSVAQFTNLLQLQLGNIGTVVFFNGTLCTFQSDSSLHIFAPDYAIDGVQAPRGLIARIDSSVNSAATGAEAVVLTVPSKTYVNGRAFEALLSCQVVPSVAGTGCFVSLRRTNLAGALLGIAGMPLPLTTVAPQITVPFRFKNNSGSNITDTLVHTLSVSGAGTVTEIGGATQMRFVEVRDIGAASDYPNVIQL